MTLVRCFYFQLGRGLMGPNVSERENELPLVLLVFAPVTSSDNLHINRRRFSDSKAASDSMVMFFRAASRPGPEHL